MVRSRRRFSAVAVALCALLAVLAGCGGGAQKAPDKAASTTPKGSAAGPETKAPEPTTPAVTVPVSIAGTERAAIKHLPIFMDTFGKTSGLKPEFTESSGGAQVAKALREGMADFAFMAVEHVLKDQSGEMRLLALITRFPGHTLLVDATQKDTIKSVADLKGQKVGVSSIGSGPHQALNLYLKQAQVDPNDVTVLPVGADAQQVFTEKKVVAMMALEPFASKAIMSGQAVVLVDTRKAEGVKAMYGTDEVPWVALVTRQQIIEQKPDLVQKMVSEVVQSLATLTRSDGKKVAGMVPADIRGEQSLFETVFDANRDAFSPDGKMTESAVKTVWISLQETGAVPKDQALAWSSVADLSFLEKAK